MPELEALLAPRAPLAAAGMHHSSAPPLHLQPCAHCGSRLRPTQISLHHQLWMCEQKQCPYPLNSPALVTAFIVYAPLDSTFDKSDACAGAQKPKSAIAADMQQQKQLATQSRRDIHIQPRPPLDSALSTPSTTRLPATTAAFNTRSPLRSSDAAAPFSSTVALPPLTHFPLPAASSTLAALHSATVQSTSPLSSVAPLPSLAHLSFTASQLHSTSFPPPPSHSGSDSSSPPPLSPLAHDGGFGLFTSSVSFQPAGEGATFGVSYSSPVVDDEPLFDLPAPQPEDDMDDVTWE